MAILPKADRNFKSILEYYEIVFILHVVTCKKLWEYKTQTEKIYLQDGWRVTTQRALFRGWPGAFLTQSWLWLKVGINDFTPHNRNSGFLHDLKQCEENQIVRNGYDSLACTRNYQRQMFRKMETIMHLNGARNKRKHQQFAKKKVMVSRLWRWPNSSWNSWRIHNMLHILVSRDAFIIYNLKKCCVGKNSRRTRTSRKTYFLDGLKKLEKTSKASIDLTRWLYWDIIIISHPKKLVNNYCPANVF